MIYRNKSDILNALLNSYEKSDWYKKGIGKKRVFLKWSQNIRKDNYQSHAERANFNNSIEELSAKGILFFSWMQYEQGNIIESIWLNTNKEAIANAYRMVERLPIRELQEKKKRELLEEIRKFRAKKETQRLEAIWENLYAAVLNSDNCNNIDISTVADFRKLFEVLSENDEKTIHYRVLSQRAFGNTKRFEEIYYKKFANFLKKYGKEFLPDDSLTEAQVLKNFNIHKNSELLYFSGRVDFHLKNNTKVGSNIYQANGSFTPITGEFSDTIADVSGQNRILITIENRANFEWYVKHKARDNDVVFYTGGFLSPTQATFLEKLTSASYEKKLHWGDIDRGGFFIFNQIKRIIPQLQPYKMDVLTFRKYVDLSEMKRDEKYLAQLKNFSEQGTFLEFADVIPLILECKVTVEQESQLYY